VPALQAKEYTVLNADAPPANAGPMISFHKPGTDLAALYAKLTEAHIVTSLRTDRKGRQYLRLSPHFYNTDEELQRVLEKCIISLFQALTSCFPLKLLLPFLPGKWLLAFLEAFY
jgi:selenocysteine lyase/cysteine desulfurase